MRTTLPRDVGWCSYAGTGYANPHAVTSVGGTTYTYDNNGNVTAIGSLDYTWDWRNRLTSAERSGGGITSYGYDHTGQRVFQATGSATTSYPNRYYNVASSSLTATTTKHIFSPDGTLLATVIGSGTSTASTTYLHPDHLGGTNVVTDEDGEVVQTLDYYPYGSQRIATGSFDEQRRFIGEQYDGDTEFSYLNARYYHGSRGQFMSQDPVFLALGKSHYTHLADPQRLNSYAYGGNNPIRFKDPKGDDYVEIGFSALAGPYAGGFGFRFDTKGIDIFYSGGGGVGYGSGFYGKYSSGDLTHAREFSVSREVFGADGFGLIGSFDSTFNPDCSLCMGNDQRGEWGIIVGGAGAGAYQQYTQSFPLITVSGVRNVLDKIFKRTFVYTAQNPSSNQTNGGSPRGVSASGTQQSPASSPSSYMPASSYGLSAGSDVTVHSADAIASFLSQFIK